MSDETPARSDDRPGILGLDALVYFVHDLDRSARFYVDRLGFAQVSSSTRGGSRERTFRAGRCVVTCVAPMDREAASEPGHFLAQHPDGIAEVVFRVDSVQHAFAWLEARGATPIDEIRVGDDERPSFAMTTPFGACHFRFVQGERMDPAVVELSPFEQVDHLTANFETLAPAALWLEHVMGFDDFWKVELGTAGEPEHEGTGLRSRVLVDPESGLKFALNEPRRPNFHASQIEVFVEENRGPGIQHAALAVRGLPETVERLRGRGVEFLSTPDAYYDALEARLAGVGLTRIDESVEELRRLGILVDGAGAGRYLLQIFMRDSASLYREAAAGPFFFELIERKGDPGFGEGNFRALFESIERDQGGQKTAGEARG